MLQWGRDTVKENLARCFEAHKAILTLSTSLLGGTAAFLKEDVLPQPYRGAALALFFVSLLLSFIGLVPFESTVDLRVPADISSHKTRALRFKRCLLAGAGAALVLGLGIIAGYFIWQG
jgi:hypothetical protein